MYKYYIFFIHPSVNGHLDCFHVLAIVNPLYLFLTSSPNCHCLSGLLPQSSNWSHCFCLCSYSLFSTQQSWWSFQISLRLSLLCPVFPLSIRTETLPCPTRHSMMWFPISASLPSSLTYLSLDLTALAILSYLLFLLWPSKFPSLGHCPCFLCLKHF